MVTMLHPFATAPTPEPDRASGEVDRPADPHELGARAMRQRCADYFTREADILAARRARLPDTATTMIHALRLEESQLRTYAAAVAKLPLKG